MNTNTYTPVKSKILKALHDKFGNELFTYTDIVKEVCVQHGSITDHSEYNWRIHRGQYACAINCYGGNDYLYKCTKRNPWRLEQVWTLGKSNMYRVVDCRKDY
jgi:hypothetical protein